MASISPPRQRQTLSSLNPYRRQPPTAKRKLSMAWWLTLPLASLVLLSALLVGGLVLRQGRQSAEELARQLEQEIGDRTLQQLTTWIEQPTATNQLNQAALTQQTISLQDPAGVTRHFLAQLQAFPDLHQLMVADDQGRAISLRRDPLNGGYRLKQTTVRGSSDSSTQIASATLITETSQLDSSGQPLEILSSATGEDLRQADWYQKALADVQPVWIEAFDKGEAIAAQPIPASASRRAQVVATVLDLSQMSQFLQRLKLPPQIQVFVLDDSGLLLSSSTDEAAYLRDIRGQWRNRQAVASQNPITQAAATHLLPQWNGTFPGQPDTFSFKLGSQLLSDDPPSGQALNSPAPNGQALNGQALNGQVLRGQVLRGQTQSYQPYEGANWLITVALPESSILGPLQIQWQQMLIMVLALLLLSLLLCRWLAQWITRPLRHLNQAAQALGKGDWTLELSEGLSRKRGDEVGELARSFDWMSGYLQDNFHQIEGQKQQLQQRNQTLLGEKSRLEARNRLKDEFLIKTSQELRVPLSGILGLAESLQAQALHSPLGDAPPTQSTSERSAPSQLNGNSSTQQTSQQRAIELIIFSARRLTTLVNDLLDLSKAQHNNLSLSCSGVELHRVVQHVLALCQPLATAKKLRLTNTIPTAFPLAYGDSHRVQQILYHLISNAIKFTPDGGITVSAKVMSAQVMSDKVTSDKTPRTTSQQLDPQIAAHQALQDASARHIKITVSDTGVGMTPELQKQFVQAFAPEGRAESASHGQGGTGLGLTIVQALVALHGGSLEARSRQGRGSDFCFTLPIFEPSAEQQLSPGPERKQQAMANGHGSRDTYATSIQEGGVRAKAVSQVQASESGAASQSSKSASAEAIAAPPPAKSSDLLSDPTENGHATSPPSEEIYSTFVQRTVIQSPIDTDTTGLSAQTYSTPTVVTAIQPQPLGHQPEEYGTDQTTSVHQRHAAQSRLHQTTTALGSKPRARILVIDDDAINIEVLLRQLSLENYQIVSTTNGEQALKLLDPNCGHERFDLVILEVMLPHMSGYEICRRLRQDYPSYQLPIIMLTAKVQDEDVVEGFRAGANDYLRKPYSSKELLSRIQTHLTNRLYGRFVPTHFIEFLSKASITDIHLGNQVSCDMTVMFSDIRGFATLSESMSPQENFDFINAYLQCVSPEVRRHQGFIVKYLGDGMMAMFPQRSEDAIAAGIAQLRKIRQAKRRQAQQSNSEDELPPEINIGIGIHYGPMMLGIVGEAQRMQGDAFSDDVNLTARLEGLTKFYGVSMLISEQVLAQLDTDHAFHIRYLDQVKVKGRKQPLPIYEVFDADPAASRDRKVETLRHFEAGVHCYQAGEFVAAQGHFRAVTAVNPQDRPARLYCRRVARLIAKPPEETWTGISAWGRK